MRKQIVVVGHSPQSQFLAEFLDKTVARLVQAKVVWLSGAGQVACLGLSPTVLGRTELLGKPTLSHVKRSAARIRSISLADRRITTENGTIDYDYLVLDQGHVTTDDELSMIRRELTTLLASIKAATNTGRAQSATVTVSGNSAERVALAVAIAEDIKHYFPSHVRRVKIRLECPRIDEALEVYLRSCQIERSRTHTTIPGLRIAASGPAVPPTLVRGLMVDRSGHAVTDNGRVEKFPEVLVLDSHDRPWQALLRFEQTMAKLTARAIEDVVEGGRFRPLHLHGQAYAINGIRRFARLGSLTSTRVRASALIVLERRLLARR